MIELKLKCMSSNSSLTVLLLLMPLVFSLQKILRLSCRNEALFKANVNGATIPSSSTYVMSVSTEKKLPFCARRCIRNSLCRNFAFSKLESMNNCKLLKGEMAEMSKYVISSAGWTIYVPLEQVSSRCQGSCQLGYTCKETCDSHAGYTCEDIDECLTTPCHNSGTCNNSPGSYSCTCAVGWAGSHCETDVNECVTNPCLNGGTCINSPGTYSCSCAPGWIGSHCQTGIIQSINYPSNYTNYYSKSWILSLRDGCKIQIRFAAFSTERCCDKVTLRDGSSSTSPLIATLSGSHTGATYQTTGTSMYVNFTTDHSIVRTGFRAIYSCYIA